MPPAPSTQPSFRFIFSSTYKGGTKLWSTRIHTNGPDHPESGYWDLLVADQIPYVKPAFPPYTTWQQLVAYAPGSDVPTRTVDVGEVGTFAPGTFTPTPLEVAAYFRFGTDARTSKNHPIYLGQYLHDVMYQPSQPDHEKLQTDQMENMRQWLIRYVNGFNVDGIVIKKTGPYGAVAQSLRVPIYTTHRDFPT